MDQVKALSLGNDVVNVAICLLHHSTGCFSSNCFLFSYKETLK